MNHVFVEKIRLTAKNKAVNLNCIDWGLQSQHEENMGVYRDLDLNTKQHLVKYLGPSVSNSPRTSNHHTSVLCDSCWLFSTQLFTLLHEKQGCFSTHYTKFVSYQLLVTPSNGPRRVTFNTLNALSYHMDTSLFAVQLLLTICYLNSLG